MLPAHFHEAAGDLFVILEKFLIVQNSGNALVTSCYAPYISVVFGIFRSLLLYFVIGS